MSRRWPRGAEWDQTDHLSLHADGRLYENGHFGDDDEWVETKWLGLIDGHHEVPDEYAGELAELLDRWHDTPSRAELERERREEWGAGRF